MIRIALCILSILIFPSMLQAQLLNAGNQQNVISNYNERAIVVSVAYDNDENVYTLVAIDSGQIGGQKVVFKERRLHLVKTTKSGEVQTVVSINTNSLSGIASLGIDKWGNVLIGSDFHNEIAVNGERIAYADTTVLGYNNSNNGFLLKVDKYGNVIGFWDFPAGHGAVVDGILNDEDGNVYMHISYNGPLIVNGTIIDTAALYYRGRVVVKMQPGGNVMWYYPYTEMYADYYYPVMELYKPKVNCPQQLLLANRKYDRNIGSYYTTVLSEIAPDGRVARDYPLFKSNWATIDAIETIGGYIYVAGQFYKTETIAGNKLNSRASATYLVRLNEMLQPEQVKVVVQSKWASVTSLKYIENYGLMMANTFADTFITDALSKHSAPYSYRPGINEQAVGFVLTSFNQDLSLADVRYADGRYCIINDILPVNGQPVFGLLHEGYNPVTGHAYKNGYTICTPDIQENNSWERSDGQLPNYTVYPMPFINTCHIRFSTPVYGYRYIIHNSSGQRITKAKVNVYNDTTIYIDMEGQVSGIYFLEMQDCCGHDITVRLSKL